MNRALDFNFGTTIQFVFKFITIISNFQPPAKRTPSALSSVLVTDATADFRGVRIWK